MHNSVGIHASATDTVDSVGFDITFTPEFDTSSNVVALIPIGLVLVAAPFVFGRQSRISGWMMMGATMGAMGVGTNFDGIGNPDSDTNTVASSSSPGSWGVSSW